MKLYGKKEKLEKGSCSEPEGNHLIHFLRVFSGELQMFYRSCNA